MLCDWFSLFVCLFVYSKQCGSLKTTKSYRLTCSLSHCLSSAADLAETHYLHSNRHTQLSTIWWEKSTCSSMQHNPDNFLRSELNVNEFEL